MAASTITNSTYIPNMSTSAPAVVIPTGTVTIPFEQPDALKAATAVGVYALAKVPTGATITGVSFTGTTGFTGSSLIKLGYEYQASGDAAGNVTTANSAFSSAAATLAAKVLAPVIDLPVTVPADALSDAKIIVTVTGAGAQPNNVIKGSVTYTLQNSERFVAGS